MQVRVRVDPDLCTGHGRCYTLAPDVFQADDGGYCHIPEEIVSGPAAEQARVGEANCPEDAITVEDV